MKKTKKALWLQIREESNPVKWGVTYEMGGAKTTQSGDTLNVRFTSLKPVRKPIRRRTPKRASEEARYRKRVKEWIKGKKCALYSCEEQAKECHHQFGRVGSLLLREDLWIPLCSSHHHEVHQNPELARQRGLLCPKGMFNSHPK